MQVESAHTRSVHETRSRILDVAREVLGQDPDAGMGKVAAAAGVVRRTVYGHFPTRADLVRNLTGQAVAEITAVLAQVDDPDRAPDAVWADFVTRLWPLVHRYRVLLALRRGEHGEEIHALLRPVDELLAALVRRGQGSGAFAEHLPAEVVSPIAFSAVFTIAGEDAAHGLLGVRAATITSLLVLGVPQARAGALASALAGEGA